MYVNMQCIQKALKYWNSTEIKMLSFSDDSRPLCIHFENFLFILVIIDYLM
jgi:hypothetical protein